MITFAILPIICSLCQCLPMGINPETHPSLRDDVVRAHQYQPINSGLHNEKVSADALQQLISLGAAQQLPSDSDLVYSQSLIDDDMPEQHPMTVQRPLTEGEPDQSLVASASRFEKIAADGLYRQLLAGVDLQRQLINSVLQSPQMILDTIQRPVKRVEAMLEPYAVAIIAGQPINTLTSALNPIFMSAVLPLVNTLGQAVAVPVNAIVSPIVNRAMNDN